MNRTLQIQLAFVGVSLLVLLVVAFLPPSFKLREVRFEEGEQAIEKSEKELNRKKRQSEIDAGNGTPVTDETPAAATPAGDTPAESEANPAPTPAASRRNGAAPRATPFVDPTEPPPPPTPTPGRTRPPGSRRVQPGSPQGTPAPAGSTALSWPSNSGGNSNATETLY